MFNKTPFIYLLIFAMATAEVSVETKQGSVVGSEDDVNNYIAFYGIPYAGNVSGKNRFQEAPLIESRTEVFKADKRNIVCAHPTPNGVVGQENCLTLNVFTKDVTAKKPVFVWLGGEGYSKPVEKQLSFRSLVEDSVFVSVNYRLSIFGFLCLGIEEAPGNAGLKDTVQALKWVKDNIEHFGGDPNNVILIGHGSGAAMVDLLTLSPKAKGLFHKAIALSGSGLAPWAIAFDPTGYAMSFGAAVNFTGGSSKELAEHLINADIQVLANAINKFVFTNNSVLFAPCIENGTLLDPFLVKAPITLLESGDYSRIPYIAGIVGVEGTVRLPEAVDENWLEQMQENIVDFLPVDLKSDNVTKNNETIQEIREEYLGKDDVNKNLGQLLKFQGDSSINVPVVRGVRKRVLNNQNTYLFLFNFTDQIDENGIGNTRHGDILDVIFDGKPVEPENSKKILINHLVAFAKKGDPVAPMDELGDVYWGPVTAKKLAYLSLTGAAPDKIDEMTKSDPFPFAGFWDKFSYAAPAASWSNANHVPSANSTVSNIKNCSGLIILLFISVLAVLG